VKAIVIDKFGGPEVLRLANVPVPDVGPEDVLIRVEYAGVNPADWKTRAGWLSAYFSPSFPYVIGFDLAGTVLRTGRAVTGFGVGERVFGQCDVGIGKWGSYAEFTGMTQHSVVRIPEGLDFAAAACVPTPALAAWAALFDDGGLVMGQSVLIHGGSGGVGSFAIQIAQQVGARVAATCSTPNLDYVRGLGAERAIDYRRETISTALAEFAPGGVDLIVDAVGNGTLTEALDLLRPGGTLCSIMTLKPGDGPDVATAQRRGLHAKLTYNRYPSGAALTKIAALLNEGQVRLPPTEVLPLEQAARAHQLSEAGHVRGKLLLRVGRKD
jgi:NADPH:quinone reductase